MVLSAGLGREFGRCSEDSLLGGRVRLCQPAAGYRVASDPVLLAAAVPARAGQSVLDLGCGTGAAALCLGARVVGLTLTGVEIEPGHAALARENARLNNMAFEVIEGDVAALPAALKARRFDHVFFNPPYHAAGTPSPLPLRERAHHEGEGDLANWIGVALARLRPRGSLTLIQRSERLPEILAALTQGAGAIAVRPLAARPGRDAKRVIVRGLKGARGPFRLGPPLVLHAGAEHTRDGNDHSPEAEAILRHAAPLVL
ncbi:MAG: methyltransferase [Pseudomonadota bacterium]